MGDARRSVPLAPLRLPPLANPGTTELVLAAASVPNTNAAIFIQLRGAPLLSRLGRLCQNPGQHWGHRGETPQHIPARRRGREPAKTSRCHRHALFRHFSSSPRHVAVVLLIRRADREVRRHRSHCNIRCRRRHPRIEPLIRCRTCTHRRLLAQSQRLFRNGPASSSSSGSNRLCSG